MPVGVQMLQVRGIVGIAEELRAELREVGSGQLNDLVLGCLVVYIDGLPSANEGRDSFNLGEQLRRHD